MSSVSGFWDCCCRSGGHSVKPRLVSFSFSVSAISSAEVSLALHRQLSCCLFSQQAGGGARYLTCRSRWRNPSRVPVTSRKPVYAVCAPRVDLGCPQSSFFVFTQIGRWCISCCFHCGLCGFVLVSSYRGDRRSRDFGICWLSAAFLRYPNGSVPGVCFNHAAAFLTPTFRSSTFTLGCSADVMLALGAFDDVVSHDS